MDGGLTFGGIQLAYKYVGKNVQVFCSLKNSNQSNKRSFFLTLWQKCKVITSAFKVSGPLVYTHFAPVIKCYSLCGELISYSDL